MELNNPNTKPYPMSMMGDNPLYVFSGTDMLSTVLANIPYLESTGKTVVIADHYLMRPKSGDPDFGAKVAQILSSLQACRLVMITERRPEDQTIISAVENVLTAQGCSFEYSNADIAHDRYWACVENGKGLLMNSLNGIGVRSSEILSLPAEDVQDFLLDVRNHGVQI